MNKLYQKIAITGLTLACGVLAVLPGRHLWTSEVFTPLAYLALVLAALWWGKRGVVLAAVLALVGFILESRQVQHDAVVEILRTLAFIIVTLGLGAVRDMAAAAFDAQRRSEQRYQDMVEKSQAAIFVYRGDTVLFANSRFRALLGMESGDVAGARFWDIFNEEDRAELTRRLEERKRSGGSDLHYECPLRRKDGQPLYADIVSSAVEYDGLPAIMVSAYDITELRMAEEKRKELSSLARRQEEQLIHSTRLAEMGEMAAGIAHELNQPLTGIKNYAKNASYMLEQGVGGLDEVKNNLQLISGQVDRASRIIGQMRELARRTERHFEPIDVSQKLRETVEFMLPQMKLTGVDVVFDMAESLPQVLGDGMRLEQVFLNLFTNARQAMEDATERRLTVRTRVEPDSDLPVVVEISDTGKGFVPDMAPRLFTPFYTTKHARHGTGLGLSISLSIIKDHQGVINAAGAEGEGASGDFSMIILLIEFRNESVSHRKSKPRPL